MITAKINFPLINMQDNTILSIGGDDGSNATSDCEYFNIAGGTWSATGALNTARTEIYAQWTGGTVYNGVLIVGGQNHNGSSIYSSTELYGNAPKRNKGGMMMGVQ
jgi:hypothetical protein